MAKGKAGFPRKGRSSDRPGEPQNKAGKGRDNNSPRPGKQAPPGPKKP